MAKNMMSADYRKIDVDALDEERYIEEEGQNAYDTASSGPDERNVQAMLSSSRLVDALHAGLANPPLAAKDQQVKDRSTLLVVKVLQTFKNSEIEPAIKALSADEGDILMKYIYKGMELNQDTAVATSLLLWHSLVINHFGLGTIMRVFSERQRL
ncbi:unnamed protein product, partial [Mesorhabditis spiculigera]